MTTTSQANYVRVSANDQKRIYQDFMMSSIDELKFKKVPEAFDRKYIQDYLDMCRDIGLINGKILEWGGSDILYSNPEKEDVTICTGLKDQAKDATVIFNILDLATVQPELLNKFDTIICTQVLNYMLEPMVALRNIRRLLKPGGYLILTVSGPCYRDRNSEGFKTFWTERGVKDMCKETFGKYNISHLRVYGTFSGAINALLGLKADDEINTKKTDFNVITGIVCRKETD